MPASLKDQAAAVERAAVNLRGHGENLAHLVAKGKRPIEELELARKFYPQLAAAAVTLHELARKEASTAAKVKALTEGLE
jgi:hypothetical protein